MSNISKIDFVIFQRIITRRTPYITRDKPNDNLKAYLAVPAGNGYVIPAKSVVTMVGKLDGSAIGEIQTDIPQKYQLYQNYPNPFNPGTKIKYLIPRNSFVSLKVFNMLGQQITTLVNEEQKAGEYTIDFSANGGNASSLASGIYMYRLQAGNFSSTKKMILIR